MAILFDLDGTLIDSAGDLANAVNEVLGERALGPLSVPSVRAMIGHGIRKLVERAHLACGLALSGDGLDEATRRMNVIYARQLVCRTILLPGAAEAVSAANALGVPLALVTNKPERFAREILHHFGLLSCFGITVGGDSPYRRKPAPDMLFHAARELRVPPAACIMVGDGEADIAAAAAAGMPSLLVEGSTQIDSRPTFRLETLEHFADWLCIAGLQR
ncbi:HAD-IA family hydrolase (plasmid) [Rhizobium sp. YTUHZ045]|uniref:HAD-IA family hydrolase n=1 Tax=Rhizobium TaxID=379 RepID=UPI0039F6C93E